MNQAELLQAIGRVWYKYSKERKRRARQISSRPNRTE
jgi:hypothetical protein